tara:strand:- start:26 stop:529 length:504 start_codon:yes stop_codon:yes gene_type:complete
MTKPTTPKWPIGVLVAIAVVALFAILMSRGLDEKSAVGFRLPDGNAEQGQVAFTKLGCVACHSISDMEDTFAAAENREVHVVLGGNVRRVKTYGHLVTALINPSHSILDPSDTTQITESGKSVMPDLTREMAVADMINLVAFLQPHYKLIINEHAPNYPYYGPGYAP